MTTTGKPKIISKELSAKVALNWTGRRSNVRASRTFGTRIQHFKNRLKGDGCSLNDIRAWDKVGPHIGEDQEQFNMLLHVCQHMFSGKAVIRNIQHGDPTPLRDEPDHDEARTQASR